MGRSAGGRACRREAATAAGDEASAVRTPWPRGLEGTLAGRVSGRAERENPVGVRVRPGKPTARKDQLPRRERMANKRMPAGRKAAGNRGTRAASFSSRLAELAGYGHMPGPKGS